MQVDIFDVIKEETKFCLCKVCGQPFETFVHEECLDKLILKLKEYEIDKV